VQAAAVLQEIDPDTVAQRWGLGATQPVERSSSYDIDAAAALRATYAALRDQMA
jgi:hypothetical protein